MKGTVFLNVKKGKHAYFIIKIKRLNLEFQRTGKVKICILLREKFQQEYSCLHIHEIPPSKLFEIVLSSTKFQSW